MLALREAYQPVIDGSPTDNIYSDVIMGTMASQITSLAIVYSTIYWGADQRKHQSAASLVFVRRIHRWPMNSPNKWPVTRKMFPFDDVFMISMHFDFRIIPATLLVRNLLKWLLKCVIVPSLNLADRLDNVADEPPNPIPKRYKVLTSNSVTSLTLIYICVLRETTCQRHLGPVSLTFWFLIQIQANIDMLNSNPGKYRSA